MADLPLLRFFLIGALVLAAAGLYTINYTQESRFVEGCAERFERVPDITVEQGRNWCRDFWHADTVGCENLSEARRNDNNFCNDDEVIGSATPPTVN